MLCSAIELGLGEDAEGIHLLGGTGDTLPLGADLRPLIGEVVLDVDVKPNRGDALSMVGLAREVAAITGGELRLPDASVQEDRGAADRRAGERRDPGSGRLPSVHGALVRGRQQRPVAGLDAAAVDGGRHAADLGGGRRDELRHARARSADARV